jgi:hypothetical protein
MAVLETQSRITLVNEAKSAASNNPCTAMTPIRPFSSAVIFAVSNSQDTTSTATASF